LLTISIDRDIIILQTLDYEITHYSSVIGVHSWAVSVENTHHPNVEAFIGFITVNQTLSQTFTFVVARAWADRVNMTPIRLFLRMLLGISIDFRGRSEEELGFILLCQS
jgi:hypothetical protein